MIIVDNRVIILLQKLNTHFFLYIYDAIRLNNIIQTSANIIVNFLIIA